MTDVEPESPAVAEAQSTGAFKRRSALTLRSPVFGAAQRPSTPFFSEVSATRTDIRLRHGVSAVVATQSTLAMDTSTRSSTLGSLASASAAGHRRASGQQSPRSSVESWLRDTPSPNLVVPPPPSCSAASSRRRALQAALPLGVDAAAVATSLATENYVHCGHSSQRTLRSGRSSMPLQVLNFTNRITDNVMQLASQIQSDATSCEDKLREEAIQRENIFRDEARRKEQILRDEALKRDELAAAREQKLREEAIRKEHIWTDENLRAEEFAARREEKLREENLKREEISARREHVLAQLKADSEKINAYRERVQAEICSKEKQVLLESELQRHKIQAEANDLIQKERIEADVRREKTQIQRALHAEFEKRNLAEKERWRTESNKETELERACTRAAENFCYKNKRKLRSCILKKIRLYLKIVSDRPQKLVCRRTPQTRRIVLILRHHVQNRLKSVPAWRRHHVLLPLLRGRLMPLRLRPLVILCVCLLCLLLYMIVVVCCRRALTITCRSCRLYMRNLR